MILQRILVSYILASTVSAHGAVTGYTIEGQTYPGFRPYNTPVGQSSIQREYSTFNPVEDTKSSALICNTPGTPATQEATVKAGAKVTARFNDYTHDTGPLIVWMTECPGDGCGNWSGKGGKWFKIMEAGLLSGTVGRGVWANGEMIKNKRSFSFTIPAALKPGSYLLRTESIALHSTAPQFYPNCAHIKLTGSGSASPPAKYRANIPGVYKPSDEAWAQPIWARQQVTTFKIPGPPVWGGK